MRSDECPLICEASNFAKVSRASIEGGHAFVSRSGSVCSQTAVTGFDLTSPSAKRHNGKDEEISDEKRVGREGGGVGNNRRRREDANSNLPISKVFADNLLPGSRCQLPAVLYLSLSLRFPISVLHSCPFSLFFVKERRI